jgi:outer membrane receptor protein involved in Fe transport
MPLRVYVKVDNVFDETYYEIGWRNPGRTVIAGVSAGI